MQYTEFANTYELHSVMSANWLKNIHQIPGSQATVSRKFPEIPFSLEPVVTRWGHGYSGDLSFQTFFGQVREVCSTMNPNDAVAIGEAQFLLECDSVRYDLAFISVQFSEIANVIEKMESESVFGIER